MTQQNLETQINNLTDSLINLVKEHCWNIISPNYSYIISEIVHVTVDYNFYGDLKIRRQRNTLKTPKKLKEICKDLMLLYNNIYDLNLFVYQSKKNETIIEIKYYPKSSLRKDFFKTVEKNLPMLHVKIIPPIYHKSKTGEKFDVNWELGGWRFQWNLFWHQFRIKNGMYYVFK